MDEKQAMLDRISEVVEDYYHQYGTDGAHDAVCRIGDILQGKGWV